MSFALHERRRDLVVGGTLSARVYDVLKDRILARELPPGARLKHAEIAEALGVSMTPVREAMLELERDGLVETIPYRGSVVKEMSPKEVRDIYNVRIALEALAAQLAAGRIADEALSQLEQLVRDYEIAFEKRDMPCGLQADLAIHELVVQEADNPILQETIQKLANRIQMFRQMDWVTGGEPLHGHRALLAALGRHDGHEAARLVAEHIERGKTHTLRILESPSLSQASDAEGMC